MTILQPVTSDTPDVSVVIPTIPVNSHETVVECLRDQTFKSFEVLVVNDANLDICEARNSGIEAANADVVALTDDDCRPNSNWVATIHAEFEAHPDLVCLEGTVEGGRNYDGTQRYVGCNLAFDRDAALTVGGFDSAYAGWRDDTEFGWRMERDADGTCKFSADVVMNHPEKPRASLDENPEAKLREEYPERYDEVLVPDTLVGQLNDYLWRKGFWDVMDSIR